jgi:inner membrane protein
MASLGHLAIGMCAGRAFVDDARETHRASVQPAAVMAIFAGLALLPDLDYVAVSFGLPDEGPFGHRGAAHSLVLPLLAASVALVVARRLRLPAWRLGLAVGLVVTSHAVLDAMTGGGSRGVPLLWPFCFYRFEAPWRPIPNAPCGLAYVSRTGLAVAVTELVQFSPFLLYALRPRVLRRLLARARRARAAQRHAAPASTAAPLPGE